MTNSASCRIQADAIVVSSQHVLAPGQLVIRRGQIVDVTSSIDETPDVIYDDCVLLPGLINSHTHLEFSHLTQPLPAGDHFPQWIRAVFALRQQNDSNDDPNNASHAKRSEAIASGLSESAACGVVALADIVTRPWQPAMLAGSALSNLHPSLSRTSAPAKLIEHQPRSHTPRVIAFLEQLGLSAERQKPLVQWRDQLLSSTGPCSSNDSIELGLSPHAPYSTPPDLWNSLCDLADSRRLKLAMHVLESQSEREWLDYGSGPMAEFLAQLGASEFRQPANFIEQLCQRCANVSPTLLIHGNYLNDAELDCLAQYPNISLVYCPRTHQHFRHRPYSMASILARNVRLLIGTDSRSTNPDLDLWQDARTALELHTCLSPSQALSAITDSAATALGISQELGTLAPGRLAAINIVRMDRVQAKVQARNAESLIETLLLGSKPCPLTLFQH